MITSATCQSSAQHLQNRKLTSLAHSWPSETLIQLKLHANILWLQCVRPAQRHRYITRLCYHRWFFLANNSTSLRNDLIKHLSRKYRLKNFGPVQHLIVWSIVRNPTGSMHILKSYVSQTYIDLQNMHEAQHAETSFFSSVPLSATTPEKRTLGDTIYPFRKSIGILRCLVDLNIQDLSNIIGAFSRHKNRLTKRHWLSK